MFKKNKAFILIVFIFITSISFAQINTNSPYSRFGVGDIARKGFGQNHAMGGIALGMRSSKYIHYLNPASYSSQDSMSFIFNFGLLGNTTKFKTSDLSHTCKNINLHHLAIAFPVTKWLNSSIGLVPYSNVGYKIKQVDILENIGTVNYFYNGSGGLQQFYIGNAIKISKNFFVGFNGSYLFGSLNQKISLTFPDNNTLFNTVTNTKIIIGDFYFTYGIQYTNSYKDKFNYTIGLSLNSERKITARQDILTQNILSYNESLLIDTLENISGQKSHILIPTKLGIGFAINRSDKIIFGADYYQQDWSQFTSVGAKDSLVNSNSLHVGLEYTPDLRAFNNYLKRIHYRFGGHYSNTYLQLKGEQLKDFGISFGVGFPFRNIKTSFNISFELGQRGTLINNLIKENYRFISFSLTLYEFWFFKPKFD